MRVSVKPAAASAPAAASNVTPLDSADIWGRLQSQRISTAHLAKHRVVSAKRRNPAYTAIDMLRTRLLQALKEHGWSRIAITSPTEGCGKTFVASNLAISMARGESRKVLLMDMDLRNPGLADVFGVTDPPIVREFLSGYMLPEEYFIKVGQNLALGLNSTPETDAAEFLLESMTSEVLDEAQKLFQPDVVIYDLPPALTHDDVIAFLPNVDGVLLVLGGGQTTADQVREVEQMLGDSKPILGMVLNKAEGSVMI